MNDYKTKTALLILSDYFGDTIHDVGKIILQHEKSTLAQIIKLFNNNSNTNNNKSLKTPLKTVYNTTTMVKQALIVLNHHNCLTIELPYISEYVNENSVDAQQPLYSYLYSLDVDNVLNRVRFIKLLSYAEESFGYIASIILEEVMLNGRMQDENIFKSCSISSGNDISTIKNVFEKLVENRFLVSVPLFVAKRLIRAEKDVSRVGRKPNTNINTTTNTAATGTSSNINNNRSSNVAMVVGGSNKQQSSSVGKRSINNISHNLNNPIETNIKKGGGERGGVKEKQSANKKIKIEKLPVKNEMMSMELRAILNHSNNSGVDGGGSQYWAKPITTTNKDTTENNSTVKFQQDEESEWHLDKTTNEDEDEINRNNCNGGGSIIESKLVLWTIGFDQYVRRSRHIHCEQVVQQQHGEICGHIIHIMLRCSMNTELGSKRSKSGEVPLNVIHKELSQHLKDNHLPPIDLNNLKQVMEFMRLSESAALIKVVGTEFEEAGPSYMVNIEGLIVIMQRKTINSIAVQRFGLVSGRIVEVLLKHKYLEQQSVCDMVRRGLHI